MPPEAISVRIPDDLLSAVDALVATRAYASRSDLIVQSMRRLLGRGAEPVTGPMENILLLPFHADPWPETSSKDLAPRPASLDWLFDEMGVITLRAGEPSITAICVPPTLGRDAYRVHNLWYRHISGTARPVVHFVQPGGGCDMLPAPGKAHPLELWSHPEARGVSLDYSDAVGTTPTFREFVSLRAPNALRAGLEVDGPPGSFVSFQLHAVVERIVAPAVSAQSDVRGPYPMGDGIIPARGETRRPTEPENAHQRVSAWMQTSRGKRVRYEVQRVRKGDPEGSGGPAAHAATVQQGVSGDWLWQTFRALSRVPVLRSEGREATVEDAMARADEALAWDGWILPGPVVLESRPEITRKPEWEADFRGRIHGFCGEHRGTWYQGSTGVDAGGSRHYLINHGDGELGKLSGVYASEAHVIAAINGYLDMAELLEKRAP